MAVNEDRPAQIGVVTTTLDALFTWVELDSRSAALTGAEVERWVNAEALLESLLDEAAGVVEGLGIDSTPLHRLALGVNLGADWREAAVVLRRALTRLECQDPSRKPAEPARLTGDPGCRTVTPDGTSTDRPRGAPGDLAAQQPLLEPGAGPVPETRLSFDDDTLTVTLDGTPHKVEDPKAYEVFKVIVGRESATITKMVIRSRVRGVSGQKTIPNLLKTLPRTLRNTVRVSTRGYWHQLPEIPEEDHS
jgi:hypothetical protein